MTPAEPSPFLNHLRHLIGGVSAAALSDGELLERLVGHQDETAVEVLVRRYGPLVFGACRRVLRDSHSAEDAFQATFLVLVRKAPSLDRGRPLGNWLYTVAYRLALRLRANEVRRRTGERTAARPERTGDGPATRPSELLVALEEELHRLPERHRAPLVLCYLEGKTNEQAALLLGCPRGSMAARLDQARTRLRERLERRGFMAPAAGISAALATAARAAVPAPLLESTVRGAIWFAVGTGGAPGVVSIQVVALAQRTIRTMFFSQMKMAGAVLAAVALLGTGLLLKAAPRADGLSVVDDPPAARAHKAADAGPAEGGTNAAARYEQAFIALRRGFAPTGEKRLVAECLTLPLDGDVRELVSRAGYALRMVQRGSAQPDCDWRADFEQGIELSARHGEAARQLAALTCLRARLRFAEGMNAEALGDVVAMLTLARRISLDGTLDSLWTGYEVEHTLIDTLALGLPRLDPRTIQELKRRWAALPATENVAVAATRMEQALLDWIEGEVREAPDRYSLLAFLAQLCGQHGESAETRRAKGRACLDACGGTAAGVLRFVGEMRTLSPRLAKLLDLLPAEAVRALDREEKALAGNPIFKVFAPVLHHVRRRQAEAAVRRALLAAALDVRLQGQEALRNHPDPIAGSPFEYRASEGGFELHSRAKPNGEVVVVTAGGHGTAKRPDGR
jgi:RNA polymerase sigma factor (sigma-70 family)